MPLENHDDLREAIERAEGEGMVIAPVSFARKWPATARVLRDLHADGIVPHHVRILSHDQVARGASIGAGDNG